MCLMILALVAPSWTDESDMTQIKVKGDEIWTRECLDSHGRRGWLYIFGHPCSFRAIRPVELEAYYSSPEELTKCQKVNRYLTSSQL
jgi:hypothetical protein